jgi:phosphocarrier protein HPr
VVVRRDLTIRNRAGIHARPAALLVQLASKFDSSIYLENDSEKVNAKSIIGVIALGATYNTVLRLSADGKDAEEAVAAIQRLVENKFTED